MAPIVSVIVCSHNRADDLERTLTSMVPLHPPAGFSAELIIVDNASTDATSEVVRRFAGRFPEVRPLREPRKGKSIALNSAIAKARGQFLAFTDDDVRPDANWLEELIRPLASGESDAVGGRIELDDSLRRAWLEDWHLSWLAVCPEPTQTPFELIGANMAFHRRVLQRVPAFDPDLGPGAAGLGEDSLFSLQLHRAGYRLAFAGAAKVVHCPGTTRLQRRSWLRMGESHGRKDGFLLHHWIHGRMAAPQLRRAWLRSRLRLRLRLDPQGSLDREGAQRWEVAYVGEIAKCSTYLEESKRPRCYSREGLKRG
jgi:glucosyl-dolichyl phosphate glucuronosyltransferase